MAVEVAEEIQAKESACLELPNGCFAIIDDIHAPLSHGGIGLVYEVEVHRTHPEFSSDSVFVPQHEESLGTYILKAVAKNGPSHLSLKREMEFMQRVERVSIERGELPGIPRAFAYTEEDGVEFLLMERAPGERLDDIIQRGPLSVKTSLSIVDQILKTTIMLEEEEIIVGEIGAETREKGRIVHNDLRAKNINYDEETDRSVLYDFGIAFGENEENPSPGSARGEIYSMSPEQCIGDVNETTTNTFQIGFLLLEMLTGGEYSSTRMIANPNSVVKELEFKGWGKYIQLVESILAQHQNIPDKIKNIIRKAMAPDPEDRYRTAKEMRDALVKTGLLKTKGKRRLSGSVKRAMQYIPRPKRIKAHTLIDEEALSDWLRNFTTEEIAA